MSNYSKLFLALSNLTKKTAIMTVKNQTTRIDFVSIAKMIKEGSKVLDIGCADGELLQYLMQEKNIDGRGLEIDPILTSKAIKSGISVIQADAENDLTYYPDHNFNYAILSQTIQAMHHPREILEEVMRIAEFAIISLPNFAYIKNRLYLMIKGKMPVNKFMPFQWYETPNIHFCSIKDFKALCKELGFIIEKEIFINSKTKAVNHNWFANLFAKYGIFLIKKNHLAIATQSEFIFNKRQKGKARPILAGAANVDTKN